ncbi:MAG TPA: ATP-binding protein, partial [Desulfurivibrionaceae bacterium]|nr:ATP-binding protein [Desulfurivibrionaceae bacterium]
MTMKKALVFIVALVSSLLVALLVLGILQQMGLRHRQQVVVESEKVLFQYAIIREHLIESILAGQSADLAGLVGELESFRQNLTNLVGRAGLPTESQLNFLNQVDISGIILHLREANGGGGEADNLRQLQRETRILGERLLLFDRLVSGQAQRNLVGLQAVVIGVLALVVGGLLGGLLLFNRRLGPGQATEQPVVLDIIRASQLTALGELTGEVAHEINDLSNGIINYAQLLADELAECGDRPETEKMLGKIIAAGERIGAISGQILVCSESREQGREPTDLNRVVADVLSLLKSRFRGQGILVSRDLPDNLPAVSGNRRQLRQLFLNLLLNAQQALDNRYPGPNGEKRLEISAGVFRDRGGEWLRTEIIDYGCGMTPEMLARAFDPDFTTKASGPGNGLGLPVCREIVREHGGELSITSTAGEQTMAVVDLPLLRP